MVVIVIVIVTVTVTVIVIVYFATTCENIYTNIQYTSRGVARGKCMWKQVR